LATSRRTLQPSNRLVAAGSSCRSVRFHSIAGWQWSRRSPVLTAI